MSEPALVARPARPDRPGPWHWLLACLALAPALAVVALVASNAAEVRRLGSRQVVAEQYVMEHAELDEAFQQLADSKLRRGQTIEAIVAIRSRQTEVARQVALAFSLLPPGVPRGLVRGLADGTLEVHGVRASADEFQRVAELLRQDERILSVEVTGLDTQGPVLRVRVQEPSAPAWPDAEESK